MRINLKVIIFSVFLLFSLPSFSQTDFSHENKNFSSVVPEKESEIKKSEDFFQKKENNFIKDTERENQSSLLMKVWQYFTFSLGLFCFFGFLIFVFLKFKNKSQPLFLKQNKVIEKICSFSLSPKRHILLLKVRKQEILISSTESGVCFLCQINNIVENKEEKNSLVKEEKNYLNKNKDFSFFQDFEREIRIKEENLSQFNKNNLEKELSLHEENNVFPKNEIANISSIIREKIKSMKKIS